MNTGLKRRPKNFGGEIMDELILTIPRICHPELDGYERKCWAEIRGGKLFDDWKWLMRFALGQNLGAGPYSEILVEYYFTDKEPRAVRDFEPIYILKGLELWGAVKYDARMDWKIILGAAEKKTVIILRSPIISPKSGIGDYTK